MQSKRTFIGYRKRAKEFDQQLLKNLQKDLENFRNAVIPRENTLQFSHGSSWRTTPTEFGEADGEFELHSVELSTKFEDIRQNRLEALFEFRTKLLESMQQQFMTSIYGTVIRSTERTGNIVSAPDHPSMAEAFLETIKKIEFGVDDQGNISLPEFHAAPEVAKRMAESLEAQSPEFIAELEHVKAEKIAAALERERERLAKFPSAGSV